MDDTVKVYRVRHANGHVNGQYSEGVLGEASYLESCVGDQQQDHEKLG